MQLVKYVYNDPVTVFFFFAFTLILVIFGPFLKIELSNVVQLELLTYKLVLYI